MKALGTRLTAAVVVLAAATLTACDGGTPTAALTPSAPAASTGTTATTAPTSTGTPVTPDTRTLVTVTRTGGFAGVDEGVIVHEDGSFTRLRRGRETDTDRMTPAALDGLRTALEQADFGRLPADSNPTRSTVADGFSYRITHGGHEVTTADPVPPALSRVIASLPPFTRPAT
ncbi:protealysin inhibitor emfourin [Streptomyces sp. NPDC089919]|uniref:protealysin inhibitor emfourin n=1 Tax=Streptomyces sp. NPDC089919 TaxID=3155188 RepID=UPI00342BC4EB